MASSTHDGLDYQKEEHVNDHVTPFIFKEEVIIT